MPSNACKCPYCGVSVSSNAPVRVASNPSVGVQLNGSDTTPLINLT